jgi:hypothetical protein
MFPPGSHALYIVSAILFLVPWSLLVFAWLALNRTRVAAPLSIWRRYFVYAALLAASVSTVLNMAWNASWLQARRKSARHGSRTRSLAESRTIFGLVVRRCYSYESFRKAKGPRLDDRLVRINVGSISVNFLTSIRLAFRGAGHSCASCFSLDA